jgi:hypothetical protein
MRSAKRTTWAVLASVVGIGVLAMLGALAFFFFAKPKPVNPGAAVSEMMNKVDANSLRIGAAGTGRPFPSATGTAQSIVDPSNVAAESGQRDVDLREVNGDEGVKPGSPAVIVLAATPQPTLPGSPTTTTAPAETTVASPEVLPTTATTDEATSASVPPDPPPGAKYGVTYCGANTCAVGLKCCCDSCVPFDQACDPRSCAAQSGLSVSVPCGMDLCDPGEVCCDARCGECARYGECPEEPCK